MDLWSSSVPITKVCQGIDDDCTSPLKKIICTDSTTGELGYRKFCFMGNLFHLAEKTDAATLVSKTGHVVRIMQLYKI